MDYLITCKEGFETILTREMARHDLSLVGQGTGWGLFRGAKSAPLAFADLCFAGHILENPQPVKAASLNSLAAELVNVFTTHIGTQRVTSPWPRLFSATGEDGLAQHAGKVEAAWNERLKKKMSRVARLSEEGIPTGRHLSNGFFVQFTGFNEVLVSFRAVSLGQQRMKMDPKAPSRSYLKIEEAFHVMGSEPRDNEEVIDLGASPGGWSYAALKRGAFVTAVDNGPLQDPVRSHPHLRHQMSDAMNYRADHVPVEWLLCDVLETPEIILDLLDLWFREKWCQKFVVNLKVGRTDPVRLLAKIRDPEEGLIKHCQSLYVRQLYHDREEITLMGRVKE